MKPYDTDRNSGPLGVFISGVAVGICIGIVLCKVIVVSGVGTL